MLNTLFDMKGVDEILETPVGNTNYSLHGDHKVKLTTKT